MVHLRFGFLAAAMATLALAACASQPASSGFGSDFAASAPQSGGEIVDRQSANAGYFLAGQGFETELIFEEQGAHVVAAVRHEVSGADPVYSELEFGDPWLADGARVFVGESDEGLPLEVTLEAGPCEFSGRHFSHFARVAAGRLRYEGCAIETGPAVPWSNDLAALLPAISLCQAGARQSAVLMLPGSNERAIVHAAAADGEVVVRYAFAGSGRVDCRVEDGQLSWRVIPAEVAPRPGEGDPVYFPGELPPAGRGCFLYERVRDADGTLLGALGYDVCVGGGIDATAPADVDPLG